MVEHSASIPMLDRHGRETSGVRVSVAYIKADFPDAYDPVIIEDCDCFEEGEPDANRPQLEP